MSILLTAEEWQLFTDSMDCSPAVDPLNFGLQKAETELTKLVQNIKTALTPEDVDRMVDEVMHMHLYPVMSKYRKYGANGDEPRVVAFEYLVDAVDELLMETNEDDDDHHGIEY